MNNNFLNDLQKNSLSDKTPTNAFQYINVEKHLKNMEKDYGLINIIKNNKKSKNEIVKEPNESNDDIENENNSILFTNSLIQTSFSRSNCIKKIINRKENMTIIFYFDKWKNIVAN